MKFTFHGKIPAYLTAKDLILAVIGEIGVDGATYRSMYFAGDGVLSLASAAHEDDSRKCVPAD